MKRIIGLVAMLGAAVTVAVALAGSATGASHATWQQTKDAGWDCDPEVTIFGYYHCSPPGKTSVHELLSPSGTDVPTLVLRVFYPTGDRTLAGIERLIRADLYAGQPCPQDNLTEWALLDLATDYRACHNFDT